MQIIYNQENAIQTKQKIDTETPEMNRKAKAKNRILAIVTIALAAVFVFCIFAGFRYLSTLDWGTTKHILIGFAAMIGGIFFGWGVYVYYSNNTYKIMPAEDYYTSAILYHHAVENKKVLKIETYGDPVYKIRLFLEDENHIVSEKELQLFSFTNAMRTDISETIIDLDKRIVYTPYNQEET